MDEDLSNANAADAASCSSDGLGTKNQSCTGHKKNSHDKREPFDGGNSANRQEKILFGEDQFKWFWQNYNQAREWQTNHHLAYWKSRSVALEHENSMLHQFIQNMCHSSGPRKIFDWNSPQLTTYPGTFIPTPVYNEPSNKGKKKSRYHKKHTKSRSRASRSSDVGQNGKSISAENEEDTDLEFIVTNEMLDFFEQSIRHKIELKKEREAERKKSLDEEDAENEDATLPPREQVGLKRTQEMKLLYGKAAPMILGMETAMQLGFDRNCDLKQPKLWPNLPLKLGRSLP